VSAFAHGSAQRTTQSIVRSALMWRVVSLGVVTAVRRTSLVVRYGGAEPWAQLLVGALATYRIHDQLTGDDIRPSNKAYRP